MNHLTLSVIRDEHAALAAMLRSVLLLLNRLGECHVRAKINGADQRRCEEMQMPFHDPILLL